jgi:RNA polymerase sigma-70 factor (ECF subfamily)
MTSARLQTRCFSPITGAAELGAAEVLGAWGAGARQMMSRAALAIRQVTGRMDEELDEALVARIAEGEERAFRTLVERHMQRSMRLAQRVLGNAADAEEVVQEAFLRLWTKADTWQPGRGRFTTWFFRILVNLCLDRRRRPAMLPIETAGDPPDPGRSALGKIYDDEVGRAVAGAIAELPERQRAALVLCYYEELSNLEAAQALSISVSALEALLVRARRTLKTRLASLGAVGPKEE